MLSNIVIVASWFRGWQSKILYPVAKESLCIYLILFVLYSLLTLPPWVVFSPFLVLTTSIISS